MSFTNTFANQGGPIPLLYLDQNFGDISDTSNTAKGDALIGVKLNATGATARTQDAKNAEVVSVKDFGAAGDGITDDTNAIVNAMAAVSDGATILFPTSSGHYVFSQLTITKTITFLGSGYSCPTQATFGSTDYLTQPSGSVLRSTAASGTAITCTTNNKAPRFANLCIVGPGTGTATALVFGAAAGYQTHGRWQDIFIVNFYRGTKLANVEDWTFDTLRHRGIYTEALTIWSDGAAGANTNQNVFINYEAQSSGSGIYVTEGADNLFVGGALQGLTEPIKFKPSGAGRTAGFKFEKIWFESNSSNVILDLTSGGVEFLTFEGNNFNTSGNLFSLTNPSNNTVTRLTLNDNAASGVTLDLSPGASVGPAYKFVGGSNNQFSSIIPSNAVASSPVLGPVVITLAANATTLDASAGSDFLTVANGGATAIASISNGRLGQVITIAGGSSTNATTIADSGVFKLNGALTLNANTTVTLKTYDGTNWLEMARSVN